MTTAQRERYWHNEAVRREREIIDFHLKQRPYISADGSFILNFAKRYRAAMNAAAKRKAAK